MKELSLEDIAERMESLQVELAHVITVLERRPQKVYAAALEPIAVSAAEAARMLSVKPLKVYQLHHKGELNGFRPDTKSDLRFLVSEIREVAAKMSAERRHA